MSRSNEFNEQNVVGNLPQDDRIVGQDFRPETVVNERPKIRRIEINELDHGYTVQVGCQHFAIENGNRLLALLSEYIGNPKNTEKLYFDGTLFSDRPNYK